MDPAYLSGMARNHGGSLLAGAAAAAAFGLVGLLCMAMCGSAGAQGAPSEPGPGGGKSVDAPPDSLSPIATEIVVAAPVSDVWRCWTTSEGIQSFLTDAHVELRIGGPFEIYFSKDAPAGSRGSEGCRILSYEPVRMLSFSWNAPPKFGPLREERTWVVLHFDPQGPNVCKVSLRHLGFAEQVVEHPAEAAGWAEIRRYFDRAWPSVLTALKEHFETAGPGGGR